MRFLLSALAWILDPAHWAGPTGIGARLGEHLLYSLLALVLATVIALPLGLWIGHTGRGRAIAIGTSGALRALPSLGLLTFLAVALGVGINGALLPSTIVLAVLAAPPILAGAYAGVEGIDRDVVDGARATGFSERQIVTAVEMPLAAPMVLGGIRSATLQVIATATIAAYLGLGGLGRFILDGLPVRDYSQMLAGAVLVTVLALAIDGLLLLLQRSLVTAGVRAATGVET
ncbi:osmoprotectant transport system permease protein [Raineyella antarctica]|uniref:Osmoprotectant transport system permease protein n=1 Tax=Raineyella antarctica TaxID=1577474 RepID=A0A1G6GGE6_9ACTN|nr:ABC transporter permease subunit [Raineyella antarctica]SDB80815.1 osmoprotectant transport system permease protein [Raineyella antarctica]